MHVFDQTFIKKPKRYIIQSLLAIVTLVIILYFVETVTHAAIVAALGSSAFIVFTLPHSSTARPRRLIGGHIIGILTGTACYYIFLTGSLGEIILGQQFLTMAVYALSAGLAIFLMTITNTEHPPAAGTALGLVIHEQSVSVVVFILLAIVTLSVVRRLLRGYLKNLY